MSARDVTLLGYLLIVLFGLGVQLAGVNRVRGVAPIGVVLARVMRSRPGRLGLLVVWAWVGLHLFAL